MASPYQYILDAAKSNGYSVMVDVLINNAPTKVSAAIAIDQLGKPPFARKYAYKTIAPYFVEKKDAVASLVEEFVEEIVEEKDATILEVEAPKKKKKQTDEINES